MKKFFTFIPVFLFVFGIGLSAQNISNTEKRRMNLAVMETLDKYERLSKVGTVGQIEEFVAMFRSPKMTIYNDLIGVSDEPYLGLREYASALHGMHGVEVTLSNVAKSEPYVSAGSICVDVTFDKTLSYYNEKNIYYSSQEIYGVPYRMTAVISYDDFDEVCYIESLEGEIAVTSLLKKDHLVLRKPSGNLGDNLRYRNEGAAKDGRYYVEEDCSTVDFGESGFAFFPAEAAGEDWYYMQDIPSSLDPDEFLMVSVSDDGMMQFSRKKKNFRARVYNSTTLAGAFLIEGDLDKSFSLSDEIGVDLRYLFNLGNKFDLGIYGGLGVVYNYVDVGVKNLTYSYQYNKKPRNYEISVLGQRYSLIDGALSGGIAMEFALSRRAVLTMDLGGKAYYNLLAHSGIIYSDYKVTYDEKTYDVRGHFKPETVAKQMDLQPDVWPCPLSAVAGIGLNINMTKTSLFTFGFKYEYGLNYYYQSPLVSYKDYENPIRASYGTGKEVAQYMFNDSFYLKRRAVWIDLGFVFKF